MTFFVETPAVDMDVERGAAWRRRQRRLRSWWRHEQQTVAAVLATVTHHSHSKVGTVNDAPRGQKKVTSTRVGPAEYYELSSDDGRPTGVSGQGHCWSPGRRGRRSGTQASGTSWSRLSMLLCCSWWNSCRMFTISSPRVCRLLPSRLFTCPRSSSRTSPRDACVATRNWRNNWWKCRRSHLIPGYSLVWSTTSTFQFLVVVGVVAVSDALVSGRSFSVVRDRAPQRFMEQNIRMKSPRRSFTKTESWWMAAADGSKIGPTLWQPPWLPREAELGS